MKYCAEQRMLSHNAFFSVNHGEYVKVSLTEIFQKCCAFKSNRILQNSGTERQGKVNFSLEQTMKAQRRVYI